MMQMIPRELSYDDVIENLGKYIFSSRRGVDKEVLQFITPVGAVQKSTTRGL